MEGQGDEVPVTARMYVEGTELPQRPALKASTEMALGRGDAWPVGKLEILTA